MNWWAEQSRLFLINLFSAVALRSFQADPVACSSDLF